ncbi:MAG: hypothetical protein ACQER4_01995 [Bacteroidota bacterium]
MIRLLRSAILQLLPLVLLLLYPMSVAGQTDPPRPVLAVSIDAENSVLPDRDQLQQLRGMGIRHIELFTPVNDRLLNDAIAADFLLMVQQNRRFVTSFNIQSRDSLYLADDLKEVQSLQRDASGNLIAFSPFLWPYDRSEEAQSLLTAYAQRLKSGISEETVRVYYSTLSDEDSVSSRGWDLRATTQNASAIPTEPNGSLVRLLPGTDDTETLRHLYRLLDPDLSSSPTVILVSWEWLNRMTSSHPWLESVLSTYHEENQLLTPYPHNPAEPEAFGLERFWVLAIALIYLLLFRYSSFVRESRWRYFTSHAYYKEQILPYRLRSAGPGLLFQFQLLLMWLLLWTLFYHSLPMQGQLLLQDWVFRVSSERSDLWVSLQWAGVFATLHTLLILWVWIFNSRYSLKEILALYGWPLQTLLIPTLLLLFLYWNGADGRWIGVGTAVWILLWTTINYLTALDILRSLERRRILFGIAVTFHLTLTLLLFLALFFYPPLQEPLQTLWFLL